jgi:O-antigen biosynthesis protein
LPASCFNQYNVAVLQRSSSPVRSDLVRLLAQKFGRGRLLLLGDEARDAGEHAGVVVTACASVDQLEKIQAGNGNNPALDRALWIYRSAGEIDRTIEMLAQLTDEIILAPGAGAEFLKARPVLVEGFNAHGFMPDYSSDLEEFGAGSIRLLRQRKESADALVSSAESALLRLHLQTRHLERTLRTRTSELEAADRHIAKLEEKILKLREATRELKQLKKDKQALRKCPERKVGQVILAPYRLPQRLFREVRKQLRPPKESKPRETSTNEYQAWLEKHRVPAERIPAMREEARQFTHQPLISIITPLFNTPIAGLEETVHSVLAQAYENWELILIDDASTDPDTLAALPGLVARDARIRLARRQENGGISRASNDGLALAKGEWVGFLDHDDLLEPNALFEVVKLLQGHPDADLIYSDEDRLTENGFEKPLLKPDWSPDFFLSYNYVSHFTCLRRKVVEEVGYFQPQYDGVQDYDLYLRVSEQTDRIFHVPRVLYHWRRTDTSTADNIWRKPKALEAGKQLIEEYLKRRGENGHVAVDWRTYAYWVKREIRVEEKISIIIPVRDRIDELRRCLDSLTTKTRYQNYEIVIVDNESSSEEARSYFDATPHRVLHFPGPCNHSAINNFAVEQTESPWILFLKPELSVIDHDWLNTLAEHVQRPEVGAVGARLLYPDDTVQHAGIVLGPEEIARPAFECFPAEHPGVCRQLQVTRNYSAVSAACMLTRRDVFLEVGGFDEEGLPVAFNDVDLCLKMGQAGYRIVYTPFARLYCDESASGHRDVEPRETDVMREKWPKALERDPYYNPNLSRKRADFSLGE